MCVVCAHVVVFVAVRNGQTEGGQLLPLVGHHPGLDSFLFALFVSKDLSSQLKDLSGVHFFPLSRQIPAAFAQ